MARRGAEAYDMLTAKNDIVIAYLPNTGPDRVLARSTFVAEFITAAIDATPRVVVMTADLNHRGIKGDVMDSIDHEYPDGRLVQNDLEYSRFTLTPDGNDHTLLSTIADAKHTRGITADLVVTVGSAAFSDSDVFRGTLLNSVFPMMRMKDVRWVHVTERPQHGRESRFVQMIEMLK